MRPVVQALGVDFGPPEAMRLRGVSIGLAAGRVKALLGPNGAGKSTLLRVLSGELTPSRGQVLYSGIPVRAFSPWRLARRRAVMMQSSRISFPYRVRELVEFGLCGRLRRGARGDGEAIVEASLALAGVDALASRRVSELSGGEWQRARFALALCQLTALQETGVAQCLMLDEPVASLDIEHQHALMRVAATVAARGAAVVVALHDLNLALRYADDVAVMQNGTLLADGEARAALSVELAASVFRVGMTAVDVPCGVGRILVAT